MSTRPIGIYNFANSYRQSALILRGTKAPGTHPKVPIEFLMYHSMELYLKSYLHAKGMAENVLSKRPYQHNLHELAWAAKQKGLCPLEETYLVLRVLNQMNTQIRSRYIEPRFYRPIRDDAIDRAASDLHHTVGKALSRLGYGIRL